MIQNNPSISELVKAGTRVIKSGAVSTYHEEILVARKLQEKNPVLYWELMAEIRKEQSSSLLDLALKVGI